MVCCASTSLSFVQQIHAEYLTHSPDPGLGMKRRGRKSGHSPHSCSRGDDGTINQQQKFEEVESHDPRNPAPTLYLHSGWISAQLALSVQPSAKLQTRSSLVKCPSSSPLWSPDTGQHPQPRASAHLTGADIHLRPDSLSLGHRPLHHLPPLEPGSWVCPPLLPTVLNRTLP